MRSAVTAVSHQSTTASTDYCKSEYSCSIQIFPGEKFSKTSTLQNRHDKITASTGSIFGVII